MMKIAIIVYSETGHTLSVALQLKERLDALDVNILELTTDSTRSRHLTNCPPLEGYDRILFGFPVQGFSLPIPVKDYLMKVNFPVGKEVGVFTTQYFNHDWLGGNSSHRQFWKMITRYQPIQLSPHVGRIHWRHPNKEQQINAVLEAFSSF